MNLRCDTDYNHSLECHIKSRVLEFEMRKYLFEFQSSILALELISKISHDIALYIIPHSLGIQGNIYTYIYFNP